MEVGLSTKPDQTGVLLLDGRNHMTGDLDLRGNKIILPGEIDMDRKLITNLDTDPNQDLSAVNMITLKNKVGPKADKNYVDGEITKLVKKTGDVLTGDLILPHDNYPVQGNTNKVISYETQREIFLSRKESFPMETDINMNNNFIQNVATPTSSHQGTNKGYCDYNFLNRQKGGRIMGSLSMNQNDLFEIPAPKFRSSAVNKNYVDAKIPSVTQFVKKTGDRMTGDLDMTLHKIKNLPPPSSSNDPATKYYADSKIAVGGVHGDLDMNNFKIKNLDSPIGDKDAVNKKYLNNELIKTHLIPSHRENAFKYLLDADESSSERNIIVNGIVDFNGSPHKNKKAKSVDLVYTPRTHNYDSQIGINIFSLPVEKYTIIMEYFWPENGGISLSCESSTAVIKKQTFKKFSDYTKILVQFVQRSQDTPDYLYFNIRGSASTDSNPEGYLVFYGLKGLVDLLPPQIYDSALESSMFELENGTMKMNMDLDLNNHSMINTSFPFLITAKYDKNAEPHRVLFNGVNVTTFPYKCTLHEVLVDLKPNDQNDYQITLHILTRDRFGSLTSKCYTRLNEDHQRFNVSRWFRQYAHIEVWLWNKIGTDLNGNPNKMITSDNANLCFKFTTYG